MSYLVLTVRPSGLQRSTCYKNVLWRVLSAVVSREKDLEEFVVSEAEWKVTNKVCAFLEAAATATKHQSGSLYVTLSITSKTFEKLKAACHIQIKQDDKILTSIATAMLRKLQQYSSLVCTSLAKLARVVDPRFWSDILNDAEILRNFMTLLSADCSEVERKATSSSVPLLRK